MNISPSLMFDQGTSTKLNSLGLGYSDGYGRVFHYAYAAGAVGRGKVGVAAATIANHNNLSFAVVPAVGDKSVSVTLGGTAVTADQYKDGWLVVQDGTGEGRAYRIEGHGAQATTTGNVTIYLAEVIDTASALAATGTDLIYNKYQSVRPQVTTTQTYIPIGVPICVGGLGAAEYGWVQTWGPCAVWQDEATAGLGEDLTLGSGTGTGQVEGRDTDVEPLVGSSGPAAGVADEYQLVYLRLDPTF